MTKGRHVMEQKRPQMDVGAAVRAVIEAAALSAFVFFALVYVFTVPYGEAAGESDHALYVQSLAEGNLPEPGYPPRLRHLSEGEGRVAVTPQGHQPPLYHALLVPLAQVGGEKALYIGGRLLSVVFGLGAILLLRAAALQIFPDRRGAVALGTVIAAAFPTYQQVMATMGNESLAVFMVALTVWVAAYALRSPTGARDALMLGGCFGLALLAKLTAAVAIVPLVAALIVTAQREAAEKWRGPAMAQIAVALALAGVISSPWFARNQLVLGSLIPRAPARHLAMPAAAAQPDTAAVMGASVGEVLAGIWWPDPPSRRQAEEPGGVTEGESAEAPMNPEASPPAEAPPDAEAPSGGERPPNAEAARAAAQARMAREADTPRPVWSLVASGAPALVAIVGLVLVYRGRDEGDWRGRALAVIVGLVPVVTAFGVIAYCLLVDPAGARSAARYTSMMLPSYGIALGLGVREMVPERAMRPLAIVALMGAMWLGWSALQVVRSFYA